MKTMRISVFFLVVSLLVTPLLRAQDLSKYRNFALGANLATVLKITEQKSTDVKVTQAGSTLFQELTWWPASRSGASNRSESVEQMLFSFYRGELYKMSVTYDRNAVEGLTADDMVRSITSKYGSPTTIALEIDSPGNDYEARQKVVASWEDSQYSFNLVRSVFSSNFELVIYSKRVNAEAEAALVEAVKLDKEEGPQREAERQKKETDALEVTRQKNQKAFRP
jgi:hypothetical protein